MNIRKEHGMTMNWRALLGLVSLLFSVHSTFASSLQIEAGSTSSVYNYVEKPNDIANRINLPDLSGVSGRVTLKWDVTDSGTLYVLYAPLSLDYSFNSSNAFQFDGVSFQNNQATELSYRFNSYRLGYLWNFGGKELRYWIGPVAKIRDAKVSVSQQGVTRSFDNVGFVPLLGVGGEWTFAQDWSLYAHLDGLAASQGSAYDGILEIRYTLSNLFKGAIGYRILGGGADNEQLENFAQFNTLTLSFLYDF